MLAWAMLFRAETIQTWRRRITMLKSASVELLKRLELEDCGLQEEAKTELVRRENQCRRDLETVLRKLISIVGKAELAKMLRNESEYLQSAIMADSQI